VFLATGIRRSELARIRYLPGDSARNDVNLPAREITVRGKGGKPRIVKISYDAARSLDRYLRARARTRRRRGRSCGWGSTGGSR
jgi:site-specific recombinase XerD